MSLASLAQLDRSHRRHDDMMSRLLDAARRLAAGRPHDTDLDVVREAVAYFERAVTRHFLDEEGSVFPRLSTRRPELAEALAELSAEHPTQIALQNAVAECAKQLDDDARPGAGKALLEVAEKLAEQHRLHVEREDAIFRDAHEALTAQDDADIVAEMETRRDRDSEDGRIREGGGRGMGGGRGGGGGGGGGRGRDRSSDVVEVVAEDAKERPTGKRAAAPRRAKRTSSAKNGKAARSTKAKRASAKNGKAAAKGAKAPKRAAKAARSTSKAKPKKRAKTASKPAKKKR